MSDRSDKWHSTRRAREVALFSDRRFEVVREVSGESFKTPLGYSAKNGYEVRNVDTGETFKVGKTTLKVMAEEYGAVELPAPKKRGRPKKAQGGPVGGSADTDEVPFFAGNGGFMMSTDEAREETEFAPKIENGNEPGAHPVADREPDDDDRSGSNAGPTYGNPNSQIHVDDYAG